MIFEEDTAIEACRLGCFPHFQILWIIGDWNGQ